METHRSSERKPGEVHLAAPRVLQKKARRRAAAKDAARKTIDADASDDYFALLP